MSRNIATMRLNAPDPMILDCTIDYIDSRVYARDDLEHRAWLPNSQKLAFETETGELKTINNNDGLD